MESFTSCTQDFPGRAEQLQPSRGLGEAGGRAVTAVPGPGFAGLGLLHLHQGERVGSDPLGRGEGSGGAGTLAGMDTEKWWLPLCQTRGGQETGGPQ